MLIDSHTHLNFKAYNKDREEVISRCNKEGMKLINVGAALATSKMAVDLALKNDNFYASIGLHPIHVKDEEFNISEYIKLIKKGRVVAIGETGLDYYHNSNQKEEQKELFIKHIKLAKEYNLPLIIHGRNSKDDNTAYEDIYNILKENNVSNGVVHCYGGNLEEAKKFLNLGLHLGFTGVITFDKTGVLREIIEYIDNDRILIETDAPYLTPEPYRGKRNEPVYIKYVAKKIAEIKNMKEEEIIELTGNNAIKLFNLEYMDKKEEKNWETVIDFTKIKKGGVNIDKVIKRI